MLKTEPIFFFPAITTKDLFKVDFSLFFGFSVTLGYVKEVFLIKIIFISYSYNMNTIIKRLPKSKKKFLTMFKDFLMVVSKLFAALFPRTNSTQRWCIPSTLNCLVIE